MLGLVVHIFCTFIFATRVVVCWQERERKEREREGARKGERELQFLQSEFFFLDLSDQEEFAWGKLWQIFSQTGKSPADYRLLMLSCLDDSFIFTQWSK